MSLKDIIEGKDIEGVSTLDFDRLINVMIRGGWPESINIYGDNKYEKAKDYIKSLLSEEVISLDNIERKPRKMDAVLKKYIKKYFN